MYALENGEQRHNQRSYARIPSPALRLLACSRTPLAQPELSYHALHALGALFASPYFANDPSIFFAARAAGLALHTATMITESAYRARRREGWLVARKMFELRLRPF